MVEFIALKEKLKSKFFPVLVVFGDDAWLRNKAVTNVFDSLSVDLPEMNKIVFEKVTDIDDVLTACNTAPFFSKQKMVVVQFDELPPQTKVQQEMRRKIENYATFADESCVLVFTCANADFFNNVRFVETVNCNRLDSGGVISWITAFCRKNNRTIDRLAAQKICDYCVRDMTRVSTETKKLCDYCEKTITTNDVDLLVHRDTEYAAYDLGKTIAAGNGAKALDMVQSLLGRRDSGSSGKKEDVRSLFSLLYNFYRRMYYLRTSNLPQSALAAKLGVREGALYFMSDVARGYKPLQLKKALEYFAEADAKLKAFLPEREVFDLLVMQLLTLK